MSALLKGLAAGLTVSTTVWDTDKCATSDKDSRSKRKKSRFNPPLRQILKNSTTAPSRLVLC